jgi:hypothetical protein
MNRATIFHEFEVVEHDSSSLGRLLSSNYPYTEKLMLYQQPDPLPAIPDSTAQESVKVVSYGIPSQTYSATLASPGLLYVADNYFPGWKVKVDGEERPLLKADYTFRAVALGAGTHEVEFYWDWHRYQTGKWTTYLAFAISLLGLIALVVIKPRKDSSPEAND